jgi:LysM repeat protein
MQAGTPALLWIVFRQAFPKLPHMLKRLLFLPAILVAVPAWAQTAAPGVEIANLHEDVTGLSQRLADLTLRVEQLESENATLRDQAKSTGQNFVTIAQLNEAIADLNKTIQSAVSASKDETPASPPAAGDFPKEGVTYTVQRGETLALIAKKTGARLSDIIAANKIADPSRIQAGQALFIPGGK